MNNRRWPALRGEHAVTDRPLAAGGMSELSTTPPNFAFPSRWLCRLTLCAALLISSGCSLFRGKSDKELVGNQYALTSSDTEEVYLRVREAKAQNSVVVQVVGDSVPVRVLPLPPGERSVFVSDLLTQTGLQDKLGAVNVTVFRATSHSPMGVPMEVKFTTPGGDVRPECDYALRPGDRLRISKDDRSMFSQMLNAFIPVRGG